MREGAPDELLAGTAGWYPRVSSWKNGELLAEDIPVTSGNVTWTGSQNVPEAVTLSVPRRDRGVNYWPGSDPDHPLARFGQQLDISIVVTSQIDGLEYETRLGRFKITDWKLSGDLIDVTAAGILSIVEEARLTVPLAPRTSGTLFSEFRRLLPAGVAVDIASTLTDRPCPQSMEWGEDRLAALYEIAAALPAQLRTNSTGQLTLGDPLLVPDPVVTFRDGEDGTLVGTTDYDTREGAYNVVVARGEQTDEQSKAQVYAIACQTTGPMKVDTYGEVPTYLTSKLLNTTARCRTAAEAHLVRTVRQSRIIPVEIVPDPRIELDDAARILDAFDEATGTWARDLWGFVTGVDMPLVVKAGETMRVDVAVTS